MLFCILSPNSVFAAESVGEPAAGIQEASGDCGENLTWTFNEATGVLSISGSGAMNNYSTGTVPWKEYKDQITSVFLESGVTSIGDHAFNYCEHLTGITIPDGVTTIGESAFAVCPALTTVVLPSTLTTVGWGTFSDSGVESIRFPSSLETIGAVAFSGCKSLASAEFSDGLKKIDVNAFYNCVSLQSAELPDSVTTIGGGAFEYCSSLTSFHYPLNWTTAPFDGTPNGTGIFKGCTLLKTIKVTEGVQTIPYSAFRNSDCLEQVVFPKSLRTIGNYAFYNCVSLQSMELPDGVTTIGESAFLGCDAMTTMDLPASVTGIGINVFPVAVWMNGEYTKTSTQLEKEFPEYAALLAGTWTKIPEEEAEFVYQYAVLSEEGELTFFLSHTSYKDYTSGTYTDISGNTYTGMAAAALNSFRASTLQSKASTDIIRIRVADGQTIGYLTNMSSWFYGLSSLEQFSGAGFDTSHVSDMSSMFSGCQKLESVDVSCFDTSSVQNMKEMFGTDATCPELAEVKLGEGFTVWFEDGKLPRTGPWTNGTVSKTALELCLEYPENAAEWAGTWTIALNPAPGPVLTDLQTEFSFYSEIVNDGKMKYSADYDERWFYQSPVSYNHDLAIMSLAMSMASYAGNENTDNGNIIALYQQLGFQEGTESFITSVYEKPEVNSIGYTIGVKNIKNEAGEVITLLAITVRSGGYGEEWAGNFEIGTSRNHAGFNKGANQLMLAIRTFIENHPNSFSNHVKIWISGYSRGAAVTNLLAARLDDGELNSFLKTQGLNEIGKEDVFAYCFECPQNTTDSNAHSASYNNIHSVVNPLDMVTKVAMSKWSYTRYGITHSVYAAQNTNIIKYWSIRDKMLEQYANILIANDIGDGTNTTDIADNLASEKIGQATILNDLVNYIASLTVNPTIYVSLHQENIKGIVGKYLGNAENDIAADQMLTEILWVITALQAQGTVRWRMGLPSTLPRRIGEALYLFKADPVMQGKDYPIVFRAHYPELCLAWMQAIKENPDLSIRNRVADRNGEKDTDAAGEDIAIPEVTFAPDSNRVLTVSGDVDVEVRDTQNILYAQILDGEVVEQERGLYAYINDDGQKVFELSNDTEYKVTLKARTDGTVTYTCVEEDYVDGIETHLVSYRQIEVQENDELYGVAEDISAEGAQAEYPLSLNQTELEPSAVQTEGEIVPNVVSVSSEGFGDVIGGGEYHTGDYCTVRVAYGSMFFKGWYEGETCLSEDPVYQFIVDQDRDITAVFDEIGIRRIYGNTRYQTSVNVVDVFRDLRGTGRLDNIILATGEDFPDALSGSYLSGQTGAPILLVKQSRAAKVREYIRENVKEGGTVYVLGGTGAFPEDWLKGLEAFHVVRLAGNTRYATNLAVLKAVGIADGSEVLIATGENYADSLSAAPTGKPLFLVKTKLTNAQKAFLKDLAGQDCTFTILGGTGAVSESIAEEIAAVIGKSPERVSGKTRYETSSLIAERYFENSKYAVLAYGENFPDSLSGGPVAYMLDAPLLLVKPTNAGTKYARAYLQQKGIAEGLVLGGPALIDDDTVTNLISKE